MMRPTGGLTLNRRCSAIAGTDGLHHRSWYKGDLHELTCLGSGDASPHCALWRNRGALIALLVERHIDDYLRTDPFSLAHALERLRRAIHYEELERREGEDWSIAKDYVRSLLRRMA